MKKRILVLTFNPMESFWWQQLKTNDGLQEMKQSPNEIDRQ